MVHTRGSGFFGFSYTTLAVGYLVLGRLFFAIPSKPMTIWGVVLSVFLVVDMCIILGVPRIRLEENWIGIPSAVWATFISLYCLIQNFSVAWGKREEEERLTGREETRRSVKEWLVVLAQMVIMAVLVIVSILLTANLILRAKDASLEAPGRKYYVAGQTYQVHLACVGNSTDKDTPTILIEAGENPVEQSLQPFIDDAYQSGSIPRYCYWDRPGFGWSDNAPSPYSAGMAADTLSEALTAANESGPYILVSAGVGGLYSRIFAARHTTRIKGVLLIDSTHEDYLPSLGAPARGFGLWLRGILSPLGIDRLAGAIFKGRTREDRIIGRSAYQTGKVIKAKLQENLVAKSMTTAEIRAARKVQMGDTSLVVVSSGVEVRRSRRWERAQEELARSMGELGAWDVVRDAPHEIWRDGEGRRVLGERIVELFRGDYG